jgi:hypothetical protein
MRTGFLFSLEGWGLKLQELEAHHYQKNVVGLKRGPLSFVSTTEELLDRKVAAPV